MKLTPDANWGLTPGQVVDAAAMAESSNFA